MEHRSPPLIRFIFSFVATAVAITGCGQPAEPVSQKIAEAIEQTEQMPDLITLRRRFASGEISSEQIVNTYLQESRCSIAMTTCAASLP